MTAAGRVEDAGADREPERIRVQRHTLRVVVAAQVLGGAGLAAGITVGGLLVQQLLGTDSLTGLPTGLFTFGSALTAYLVGRLSRRFGRRLGLGLGFAAGGAGALGVVLAAAVGNLVLLFVSLFVYGAGTATNLQARYAGTDLALPARRGLAVSVALVSTTVGAVAGPNLVEPLGGLATRFGLPALSGPFLLAGVAYLAAGGVLVALLRPDPLLLARELETQLPRPAGDDDQPVTSPRVQPAAHLGATVMVLTQVAMVAVMTMTPIHLRAHQHGLGEVGLVIGLHIAAMYLPSLGTGLLVDRIGRGAMALAAATALLLAGLTAALAPGEALGWSVAALMLLGLGWNFGLIAGTAMVVDATVPANRAQTQGSIDVLVALAGAGGGVASGFVVAASSYAALALGCGLLALVLVPVMALTRARSQPARVV